MAANTKSGPTHLQTTPTGKPPSCLVPPDLGSSHASFVSHTLHPSEGQRSRSNAHCLVCCCCVCVCVCVCVCAGFVGCEQSGVGSTANSHLQLSPERYQGQSHTHTHTHTQYTTSLPQPRELLSLGWLDEATTTHLCPHIPLFQLMTKKVRIDQSPTLTFL